MTDHKRNRKPATDRLADEKLLKLFETQRFCYFVSELDHVKGRGYRASIVIEGEEGHRQTGGNGTEPYYWGGDSYEEAQAAAKLQNAALGLTEMDVLTIVNSSMFKRKRSRRSTAR